MKKLKELLIKFGNKIKKRVRIINIIIEILILLLSIYLLYQGYFDWTAFFRAVLILSCLILYK